MPASTGSCCCSNASGWGTGCQLVCKELELAMHLQGTGTALITGYGLATERPMLEDMASSG